MVLFEENPFDVGPNGKELFYFHRKEFFPSHTEMQHVILPCLSRVQNVGKKTQKFVYSLFCFFFLECEPSARASDISNKNDAREKQFETKEVSYKHPVL